jgi:hypothetical protein
MVYRVGYTPFANLGFQHYLSLLLCIRHGVFILELLRCA